MIFLENNENDIKSILDKVSVQWWLYKGTMARVSISVSFYKAWFNAYKLFLSLYDYADKNNDLDISQVINNIKQILSYNTESVKPKMSDDLYDVLLISQNKIFEALESIH